MKGIKLFIFLLVFVFSITSATFADTLKYGSKGAEVTKLQTQLAKLGYFKGNATGYYGSQTQAAVKKFQAVKGISTTGTVGPQTTKALSAAGTSSRSTTSVEKSTADKETIKKIQEILQKMGLYKGKVDGLYGKMTTTAVKEFQKKYGMKSTGTLDKETETKVVNHYASTATGSRGGSAASDSQASRAEAVNADKQEAQLMEAAAVTAETAGKATEAAEAASEFVETVIETAEGEGEGETTEPDSAEEDSAVEEDAEDAEDAAAEEPAKTDGKKKIELLDWWTAANKVFARGSTAKVIDVRTGKSFYIKRTYGGNHADCETLTKEDTKIMKEIWGGFSWSRRPVIVEIKGRYLAASMAAMPHAGLDNKPTNATVSGRSGGYGRGTNLDAVKNNGMDGHFDIHFKNSRTHGTNKVDSAHQKAIKEAAAAKL